MKKRSPRHGQLRLERYEIVGGESDVVLDVYYQLSDGRTEASIRCVDLRSSPLLSCDVRLLADQVAELVSAIVKGVHDAEPLKIGSESRHLRLVPDGTGATLIARDEGEAVELAIALGPRELKALAAAASGMSGDEVRRILNAPEPPLA